MKLSKEQKQQLIELLDTPWGRVRLQCDSYRIDLMVERYKGMTYRVVTYVNGRWEAKWMSSKEVHPEQKFLRKSVRQLTKKAERDQAEKNLGKRLFKKLCEKDSIWTATYTLYDISWSSGRAAINHLCKVCDSIQILDTNS